MKIAIPHENGRLHGHFGGCREFAVVQVDAEKRVTLNTDVLPAPEHKPGAFPRWLREEGVEVVIAGGIGHRALANFAHHGITVRAGIPEARIEALVAAYLSRADTDSERLRTPRAASRPQPLPSRLFKWTPSQDA